MENRDEHFMRRCIELASKGLGSVQPNPMVGAVLVVDDKIIAEGWHRQFGGPHAEINAINSLSDKSLLKKATMYVSLEPCAHYGKTPPCANAIVSHGIPKVVIGSTDPFEKVNGKGIAILQNAGIEVKKHILKKECDELNKRFFTFHLKKRPYIILKWAQTKNGFMDVERKNPQKEYHYWITNEEVRVLTHKWRSEEDAILIGYNTLVNDHPQLTNRLYPGKNPQKVILERAAVTIENERYNLSNATPDLAELMQLFYRKGIQSVLVEGGRKTLDRFINANLVDEIRVLVGNQEWDNGVQAPTITGEPTEEYAVSDNKVKIYHYNKP